MFFTAAMVILPVLTFFICKYAFNANDVISGGIAALMANIVLVGYIVVAFSEDSSSEENEKGESRKSR